MKKKLLSSVLALLAAFSLHAAELNIYASGLNATQSAGVTTVDYFLNAPATSLSVKLYSGSTLIATIPIIDAANLTKGAHSGVEIDLSCVPAGTYSWRLDASATANGASAPVEITSNTEMYQYFLPQDIVVDNNPESDYFGRIYVCNSVVGDGTGLTDNTDYQERGIYIYKPDLTFWNGNTNSHTGGYDAAVGGITGDRNYFKRLAIDDNGYVYVASRSANKVFRMNPAAPNDNFTLVLTASSTVDALEVVGSNLYTLEGISDDAGYYKKYSLGNIPVGSATSTTTQSDLIGFGTCLTDTWYDYSWRSDHRGGFWGCEYVAKGTKPNLVHINSSGEKDYEATNTTNSSLLYATNTSRRGTIGINPAGDLLAIGSDSRAVVYSISYASETGIPTLTKKYETANLGSNRNIDGIAFDVANNLYVACGSVERFYAYATPKASGTNHYETHAKSTNTIEVENTGVPHIYAYDLNVTPSEAAYTFTFTTNLAATSGAIEFYDATTESRVGEVAIVESIVKGNNEVTIPIADFPGTIDQEMTWRVRLTGEANESFSLIHKASAITHDRGGFVSVDASPESDYFGRIYYFNRRISTYSSSSGMYFYTPDYNTRSSLIRFGESSSTNIGIMHTSVDEDGKIWTIDYTDAHSGVYIITPGELASNYSYSQMFQGSRDGNGLFTNNEQEVGGNGTACFIYGSGENKKLYTTQEDFTTVAKHPLAVYDVKSATTWSTAPSLLVGINNANGNNSIYVVPEGIWISQNRGKGNNTTAGGNPALQFFNMDGTLNKAFYVDVQSEIDGCNGAGMTVDPIHNKLYMIDGSNYILEFNISYGANNTPSLSFVARHCIGYTYISTMCLDYAGNLIVAAGNTYNTNGSMRMMVLSPATADNTTTIPAKKALTVTKKSYERESLTINNLSTICLPYAISNGNFAGAEIYEVAEAHMNGEELQYITLSEVNEMVAGKPYFIKPSAETFTCIYSGDIVADPIVNNGLVGKLSITTEYVPNDGKCYILNGGYLYKVPTTLAADAIPFIKNRAYFDLDEYEGPAPAPGRILTIPAAPENATGIENVGQTEEVQKFFQDGKFYIRRGNIIYDALGRMVK